MNRKYLLAPALLAALSISNANASDYYNKWFAGTQAAGSVTFKLSGYCQGSVTLPLTAPYASIQTGSSNDDSASHFYAPIDIDGYSVRVGSRFYGNTKGSSATLAIQKGGLKFSGKTSSIAEGNSSTYSSTYFLTNNAALGTASCKNGQTFSQLMDSLSYSPYFNWDAALKHQASFSLQGKQAPFQYRYTQKSSGTLQVPAKCKVTGDNTDTLANDTYKATCKQDPVIKLSISTSLKGEMIYDFR